MEISVNKCIYLIATSSVIFHYQGGGEQMSTSTTTTTAVPEKFKPTHPLILVVPSRDFNPSLKESLVLLKALLAIQLKGMECDFVGMSECKIGHLALIITHVHVILTLLYYTITAVR